MTQVQLIRKFATGITGKKIVIYRIHNNNWELNMQNSIPRLGIPVNLKANDEIDKAFRRNFVRRCPLARGFSNATISILHELGHYFTWYDFLEIEEEDEFTCHFDLPSEVAATDWAIEWLQNPENRKVAKAFEKEFFNYGND